MIIKVCGMREPGNIREAEQAGVDWMGFICYPRSPRFVARRPAYLPRYVRRIGVFVNARQEEIMRRADELGLHGIQLHGSETPELCRHIQATGLQVIKAFAVSRTEGLACTEAYADCCDYFLFDTPSPSHGGSGRTFDWQLLDEYQGRVPFLLSGGLTPASLPGLLRFHHPRWAGIDLNSGFETAPAVKNCTVLSTFIHELKEQKL